MSIPRRPHLPITRHSEKTENPVDCAPFHAGSAPHEYHPEKHTGDVGITLCQRALHLDTCSSRLKPISGCVFSDLAVITAATCAPTTPTAPPSCSQRKPQPHARRAYRRNSGPARARLRGLSIQFDHYHSTHSPENQRWSETIFKRLEAGGHIAVRDITQAYDPEKVCS
ncbi:MAG: hypothetical protein CM15mP92_1140 [Halieaceae bacterium]|nr:MAG: hypothetical protein CM15mP92_1140 [Halieaceae bacterium]